MISMRRKTNIKDVVGNMLYVGDTVEGSFGIPPTKIIAVVKQKENKRYVIETPEHTPKECGLKKAVELLELRKKEESK